MVIIFSSVCGRSNTCLPVVWCHIINQTCRALRNNNKTAHGPPWNPITLIKCYDDDCGGDDDDCGGDDFCILVTDAVPAIRDLTDKPHRSQNRIG